MPVSSALAFIIPNEMANKLGSRSSWITLLLIGSVPGGPRLASHVPLLRNIAFASTLYHEVGHHLDRTIGAPARSGESAVDSWEVRLCSAYFRKQYWYLVPFVRFAKAVTARASRG